MVVVVSVVVACVPFQRHVSVAVYLSSSSAGCLYYGTQPAIAEGEEEEVAAAAKVVEVVDFGTIRAAAGFDKKRVSMTALRWRQQLGVQRHAGRACTNYNRTFRRTKAQSFPGRSSRRDSESSICVVCCERALAADQDAQARTQAQARAAGYLSLGCLLDCSCRWLAAAAAAAALDSMINPGAFPSSSALMAGRSTHKSQRHPLALLAGWPLSSGRRPYVCSRAGPSILCARVPARKYTPTYTHRPFEANTPSHPLAPKKKKTAATKSKT